MKLQTAGSAATDVVLRLVGESGEGTVTLGDVMVEMLTQMGLDIYTYQTFPAEIKGGTVMYQVRARSGTTLSPADTADILVALNDEGFELFGDGLHTGGILVYNSDVFAPPADDPDRIQFALPITTIARAEKDAVRHEVDTITLKRLPAPVNTVGLGALLRLVDAPLEPAEEYLKRTFARKGEAVMRMNVSALHAGATAIEAQIGTQSLPTVTPVERGQRTMMVNGTQMFCLGALAAGLEFFAGYPITPATEVFEFLAKDLPAFGGDVIQAEDEIAALGMCLGASYAGRKSMTATSGPGLSLMVEQINLAAQAEIPVVIVDVQRGGASTGMPTKTSQGDLNLAVFGVHNESARVVLAPTSVSDCFWTGVEAVNIAERYQCPVIVLSDQGIATRKSTVAPPDLGSVDVRSRLVPHPRDLGASFKRYAVTESGISPMSIPGTEGGVYTSTGIEHDETGDPCYTPGVAQAMRGKRFRKLDTLLRERGRALVRHWGESGQADVGVIGFGSTEGVIREASERALKDGCRVAHLQLRLISPLPADVIREFAARCDTLVVVELNTSGQLANLIRMNTGIEAGKVNKDVGLPFLPHEIHEAILVAAARYRAGGAAGAGSVR